MTEPGLHDLHRRAGADQDAGKVVPEIMRGRPLGQPGATSGRLEHDGERALLDRRAALVREDQAGLVVGRPLAQVGGQNVGLARPGSWTPPPVARERDLGIDLGL